MSLQTDERHLKATAPEMRRMLARLHPAALDALERLARTGAMFRDADAWPSRTEFRRSIMRQLHAEGLVRRGPRVTLAGRDMLEFTGRA